MNRNKKENQGAPVSVKVVCAILVGALVLGVIATVIMLLVWYIPVKEGDIGRPLFSFCRRLRCREGERYPPLLLLFFCPNFPLLLMAIYIRFCHGFCPCFWWGFCHGFCLTFGGDFVTAATVTLPPALPANFGAAYLIKFTRKCLQMVKYTFSKTDTVIHTVHFSVSYIFLHFSEIYTIPLLIKVCKTRFWCQKAVEWCQNHGIV